MNVENMAKAGYHCPMCGSKDFRFGYHDLQLIDSAICNSCGLRWREDNEEIKIYNSDSTVKDKVHELMKYRKNRPSEKGIYAGIPHAGFVWVLHKTGDYKPVLDPRGDIDYKEFGHWRRRNSK